MKITYYALPETAVTIDGVIAMMVIGLPHVRPENYKKLCTSAKLAVIASRKRRGDITKVAERTNFSTPYVSQVLNKNRSSNPKIVNAAYDIARGRQKNSQK